MKSLWFLSHLKAPNLACIASWMLAEKMRPLGQRQRTVYYSKSQSITLLRTFLQLKFLWSDVQRTTNAGAHRINLSLGNPNTLHRQQHVCPLLWRETPYPSSKAVCCTEILAGIVHNKGLCSQGIQKWKRTTENYLPITEPNVWPVWLLAN